MDGVRFRPAEAAYPSIAQAFGLVGLALLLQLVATAGAMVWLALFEYARHSAVRIESLMHPGVIAVANALAMGLVVAFAVRRGRRPFREACPLGPVRPAALAWVAMTLLGAAVLVNEVQKLVTTLLPIPDLLARELASLMGGEVSLVGSAVALVVVAPITEELLFRGVILTGFLERYGAARSVAMSAALFGVMHLNPWQFVNATALGALFGWWFVRTGSLVPCLIGHVAFNAFAMAGAVALHARGGAAAAAGTPAFAPLWADAGALLLVAGGFWLSRGGGDIGKDSSCGNPSGSS